MNDLENIYLTYLMVKGWLTSDAAHLQYPDAAEWERKEELNDYGYFILVFGQLENYVNQEYQDRFGSIEGTTFWDRVSELFIESEVYGGPMFYSGQQILKVDELIMQYWNIRREIAHGRIGAGQFGGSLHLPGIYQNIRTVIEFS